MAADMAVAIGAEIGTEIGVDIGTEPAPAGRRQGAAGQDQLSLEPVNNDPEHWPGQFRRARLSAERRQPF